MFQYFGTVILGWIFFTIYILIGIVVAVSNEDKWKCKKYEAVIKFFFVLLWPIVILLFPLWLLYRFIDVSVESQQRRKRIEND